MNQDAVLEARNTYIGRLFTLGGSLLFLVGSIIAVIIGYNAYQKTLCAA